MSSITGEIQLSQLPAPEEQSTSKGKQPLCVALAVIFALGSLALLGVGLGYHFSATPSILNSASCITMIAVGGASGIACVAILIFQCTKKSPQENSDISSTVEIQNNSNSQLTMPVLCAIRGKRFDRDHFDRFIKKLNADHKLNFMILDNPPPANQNALLFTFDYWGRKGGHTDITDIVPLSFKEVGYPMNYVIVIEPPKVKTKGALPVAETPLPKEAIPLCWAVTAATSSIGNVGALSSVINAKTQKVEI